MTAKQFENLSEAQAMQLYVSSLEKANVSQAQMTSYMEAIANDATALIPMFQNGGKAAGELASSSLQGMKNQIAAGLMPALSDVTVTLPDGSVYSGPSWLALKNSLANKANQADLNSLSNIVSGKANSKDLGSLAKLSTVTKSQLDTELGRTMLSLLTHTIN